MNRWDVNVAIPHGRPNSAWHLTFEGDYKTFCGKVCENWEPVDRSVSGAINSEHMCKRCRVIYFK